MRVICIAVTDSLRGIDPLTGKPIVARKVTLQGTEKEALISFETTPEAREFVIGAYFNATCTAIQPEPKVPQVDEKKGISP